MSPLYTMAQDQHFANVMWNSLSHSLWIANHDQCKSWVKVLSLSLVTRVKMTFDTRYSTYPNWGHNHFFFIFGAHMNVLFIIKLTFISTLIKRSHNAPPHTHNHTFMSTIEPKMLVIVWTRSPISFKHMSLWYPFLEPHQNHIGHKLRCLTNIPPTLTGADH